MNGAGSRRDQTVDQLRAIAVLWVIAGHALIWSVESGPLVSLFIDPIHGVGLFFALSGFLVAGSVERSFAAHRLRGLVALIARRWLRLALPHAAAFALFATPPISALLMTNWNIHLPASPLEVVWQLALFGAWLPVPGPGGYEIAISSVVVGNWSISAEWFAALIVIPYATLRLRSSRAIALIATLLTLVGAIALAYGGSHHFMLIHLPSFLVGVWAHRAVAGAGGLAIDRLLMLVGALCAGVIGLVLPDGTLIPAVELLWGVLIAAVVGRASTHSGGALRAPLAWVGARSYGIYLFHALGISAAHLLLAPSLTGAGLFVACVAGGIASGLFGGALTARLFEAPAISLGRRLERRLLR